MGSMVNPNGHYIPRTLVILFAYGSIAPDQFSVSSGQCPLNPPIADICGRGWIVRFVPYLDIADLV